MFAYDTQIAAAVGATPTSIDDVLATMGAIDAVTADGDGLKWFNGLYLTVTQSVHARVDAGGFADPDFMSSLDVTFATLYFSALADFLAGLPLPGCWQVLFAARGDVRLTRLQCALAGMNAHINHDLPFAVATTCEARGIQPEHGCEQYDDYTALNTTLDGLIQTARAELRVRLLGDDLPPVTHVEDTVAAWSMSVARENAWTGSEVVWHLRGMPALGDRYAQGLDVAATLVGKTLLVPVP